MKDSKINLLNVLECAQIQLSEDIQTLGYIQDEYLMMEIPTNDFQYKYKEIQNKIMTVLKSMTYNRNYMKEYIEKAKQLNKGGL